MPEGVALAVNVTVVVHRWAALAGRKTTDRNSVPAAPWSEIGPKWKPQPMTGARAACALEAVAVAAGIASATPTPMTAAADTSERRAIESQVRMTSSMAALWRRSRPYTRIEPGATFRTPGPRPLTGVPERVITPSITPL